MTITSAFETFRRLHGNGVLRLANAWDAGTARLIESLGAQAIATTSAGVAWSHGYADGDHLPVSRLVATVTDILRVVRCHSPWTSKAATRRSRDRGRTSRAWPTAAWPASISKTQTHRPSCSAPRSNTIKRACARAGTNVFVNARTDVYLRGLAPAGARVEPKTLASGEALSRSRR